MNKIKYCEQFFRIGFSDPVSKKAYLKACKWLALHVYGNHELAQYVSVQVEKLGEAELPTFEVRLYIMLNENDLKLGYCGKCRSLSSMLYFAQAPDCNSCKMQAYRKHQHSKAEGLVKFWKEAFRDGEDA